MKNYFQPGRKVSDIMLDLQMNPTEWVEGNRVMDKRGRTGTVVYVQRSAGIQLVGTDLDDGSGILVSMGQELRAAPEPS